MKLLTSEKAEAELVGHVIILGITVLGISMIALYGVPAILGLQDMANVKNAEQAFTVLDSRASKAILGDSPLQIASINLGGGSLVVEPNGTGKESYMTVKTKNNTFNIAIPMGKVKYQLGDRIVAYEGGGLWSKYPSGGSVMLSAPQFNYNGVTLMLPLFNITGNTSVGGKGTATVTFTKTTPLIVFPNPTCTTAADCPNRTNPVNITTEGKIYVNITSEFYDAWADYARSLSSINITENKTARMTSLEFNVLPAYIGETTSLTDPIAIRGLDPGYNESVKNFSFNLKPDGNSLDWDIRTASGTKELIFWLSGNSKDAGDQVDLYIGYQQGSGPGTVETWKGTGSFTLDNDRTAGGSFYVDLLNKSINLTYQSETVGSRSSSSCNPSGKIGGGSDFNTTGFSWGSPLNQKSIYNITQHYIQLMAQDGDISFSQCNPSGSGPNSDTTMLLNYLAPGGLTYLHITDNKADVGIS